jgi:serine/threonine protein kinase/tetratricopeptide (TPR) repeat protein
MRRITFDNRYRILKKIGSGATSNVYKTRDLKNNTIIALKVLSKTKTSSGVVQHFRREFKLLADLRHPNLCSVYNFGILKDGRSYFTMDYIEGKDIFTATRGLTYEKLYPLIVQLCRVLEYIHSKGLIHYDIKPSNVLIAKGSVSETREFTSFERNKEQGGESNKKHSAQSPMFYAKLLDFGLTGEQKTKDGMLIKGAFPYIAPEVIKGLTVDPRADLYSLGVLLYRICTRKSFKTGTETTFASFLQQQRECVAVLPSKIVTNIPKQLEQLIIRLLSSEPAARFSRANEVIKEINKFSREKFDYQTKKTIEGYLLSSRFVGRKKEIRKLQSLYEQMQCGDSKVVLITGEAGIGKSRLLNEFKMFVQMKRSHTFTGYVRRDKTGPLEPFHDIFRELIIHIIKRTPVSRPRRYKFSLAVLFKMFPDLSDGHEKRGLPRLVPLEPNAEKLRTFEALSELIRYGAVNLGELVILLEDLHWADELSIQFLEYVGRNLDNRNILICGTCRTEELKDNVSFKKMVNTLQHDGRLVQIKLNSLNVKDLNSFLDSTLTPSSNSLKLSKYLMKKSGGNPFFAEEIMWTLLQTKQANIGEQIDIDDLQQLSIPTTIEDIVLKRIKKLSNNSRIVVEFTALLLKGFEFSFMKALTGLDNTELSRSLWELKRKNVLVEESNNYQFYHTMLAEAVRKELNYYRKKRLYYHIGKMLEKINRRRLHTVIEDLAYYYINAKDRKKGVSYGLRAAKKSHERYAHEQAIRFYKGVLTLLDGKEPDRRFDVLLRLAQIKNIIENPQEAIKYYNQALHLKKGDINEKINIYRKIANIYEGKGNIIKALQIYDLIIKHVQKIRPRSFKSILHALIEVKVCRAHQILGDYKNVNKLNLKILDIPKKYMKSNKTTELLIGIYTTLGMIEYEKGEYGVANFDLSLYYYKEAFRYFKKLKNETGMASTLDNIGICYYLKDDYSKASLYFKKSTKISEKIGYHSCTMYNIFNMGNIYLEQQVYLKAADYYQKTFCLAQKFGNQRLAGQSFSGLGVCFLKLSHYEKAIDFFEKSLKIFNALGWKYRKVFSLRNIGETYQLLGDYMLSLKLSKEALKISKEARSQLGVAYLSCNIGAFFVEIGEFRKAMRFIEDSLRRAHNIESNDIRIKCNMTLCLMHTILKNIKKAKYHYEIGANLVEKSISKNFLHKLLILNAYICYYEQQYRRGIIIVDRVIKAVKKIGRRDILVEALLIKAKSEMKHNVLSKIEIYKILTEAKTIAEEIKCPEILWKIYFEYGKFYYGEREFSKASYYYKKCVGMLKDVSSKFKNKSYERSYLNRPDRQAVFNTIDKM